MKSWYTETVTDDELKEISDQMLADRLRDAARRVKEGEEARVERAQLIDEAARRGSLTQEQIAELAGMRQQSVNKRIKKTRSRAEQDTTE